MISKPKKREGKKMMKKRFLSVLVTGLFFLTMTGLAQASLTTIGTATYDDGAGSKNYNLIWDDDNNGNSVIWLDYTNRNSWSALKAWADGLNGTDILTYHLDGYQVDWGTNVWRLPDTVDGPYVVGCDGTTTAGYNITTSEMGHLYYTELGNKGYYATDGTYPQDGWGLNNTGDFNNLIASWYWSGTEYADNPDYAWLLNLFHGNQYNYYKPNRECGLAVRSGQVSAAPVPVPGTMLLFSTGLAGLAVLRRKRKGSCV